VPSGDYAIPLGVADIKRVGTDVTIAALAAAVHHALSAAQMLEEQGISAEVIDVRTVVPLDRDTIVESVAKTGRLIAVDAGPGMCSVASEIAASVAERGFAHLTAPIVRLTAPDVPVPFSPELERLMYPTPECIAGAVRRICSPRMRTVSHA
jgi:pyruvate/2-oxoglutarate/acetoin dehydrogenase E1 component